MKFQADNNPNMFYIDIMEKLDKKIHQVTSTAKSHTQKWMHVVSFVLNLHVTNCNIETEMKPHFTCKQTASN